MKLFASYAKLVLSIVILEIIVVHPLVAQVDRGFSKSGHRYTIIFKGEPLKLALKKLVQQTEMSLIYDPALMVSHRVFKVAKNKRPEQILRLILKGSGLDFIQLSSGTYVLTTGPQQPIQRGALIGRVIDQATGGPLGGANITLVNAPGGAVSNNAGYFSIPELKKGVHKIAITYVGYKPVQDTVWIPANQTALRSFSMISKPVLLKPVVVSDFHARLPAASAFTENQVDIKPQPFAASGGIDAIKSLNTISGINFSLPLADFNIQGGKNGSHRLLLDGVPIYNPVSMGRLLGAFSPFAFEKITVKKAGFGVVAGSKLSGIVNLHQGASIAPGTTFLAQINPLNFNLRADHEFKFNNGPTINVMAAARSNIWNWYKKPALKQTLRDWDRIDPLLGTYILDLNPSDSYFDPRRHNYDITYSDLHFAARINYNPFHQTYISAYRGKNILGTSLYSEKVVAAPVSISNIYYVLDRYNWTNAMIKVAHSWLINSRFSTTFSGYITHHKLNHNYSITNNSQYYSSLQGFSQTILKKRGNKNGLTESSFKFKLNYTASKNYHIKTGLNLRHLNYRFYLSDRFYQASQSESTSLLVAGYVQNNFFLSHQTSLSVGSRLTFIPSRDLVFAEPRLSVTFDFPNTSVGYLSAKLSGGIYRQFINQFSVSNVGPSALVPSIRFWVPVDYTTTVPKAYHIAGDALWQPHESWQVRFETYYKWIPARLVLDYKNLTTAAVENEIEFTNTSQHQFITQARGYAYGVAVSAEKAVPLLHIQLKGKYEYNISKQRIDNRFGGNYQPVPWSQPHSLTSSVHWKIKPNLLFMLQWKGIWGRSWGFRKAYYDYLATRLDQSYGRYQFNNPAKDKLPLYAQLNAGISYKLTLGDSNLLFRLNAFNLFDHSNVLNWWLLPYNGENGTTKYKKRARTMPGFSTSFSVKFTF